MTTQSRLAGTKHLRRDPIRSLLAADDAALRSMARRELLGETMPEITLAELPGVRRGRCPAAARWPVEVSGGKPGIRSRAAYDQMETYCQLGVLVCKFGLDRQHPAVAAAAGSCRRVKPRPGTTGGSTAASTRRTTPRRSPSYSSAPGTKAVPR